MANRSDAPPSRNLPRRQNEWHQLAEGAARLEAARPDSDRVTFGRLIEHGPAKHMFRPSAELSYFVHRNTARR
jgi:hypothetical protein